MGSLLNTALLAQNDGGGIAGCMGALIYLAIIVFIIAGMWKTFAKAGQPGWAAIVPFYNVYVWCKIIGRPGWWLLLLMIPFVSIIFWFIVCIELAKSFGKGVGFGIGIALLGFVFIPIIGFGQAQYQGPAAT